MFIAIKPSFLRINTYKNIFDFLLEPTQAYLNTPPQCNC